MIWDAIIVGAGPAGCAAAYDLAAAGRRVLLLDTAEFPRPKACAGGLTMRAVRALRYSVATVVRRSVSEIVLEADGAGSPEERALPVRRGSPLCLMTVRAELDAFCLQRTVERGAVFRRIGTLDGIEQRDEHVVVLSGGERIEGRYLVGADGVHSRVRALCYRDGAPWFRRGFALEANVPLKEGPGRQPAVIFDFAPVQGGYGWLFPRNDHVNIGLYAYQAGAPALDRQRLAAYIQARSGAGEFTGLCGQFLGMGAEACTPSGERVLLVGDACGFADPLTGEGIYGAIASGQAAAAAIVRSLARCGSAQTRYLARTQRLRSDLAVARSAATGFYAQPARAFRMLRYPLVRQASIQTFSHGSSITLLAAGVRTLAKFLTESSSPYEGETA